MRFTSIASGSSGNCTYVGSDNTHILIDAGTSKKRIQEGLNKLQLDFDDLDAIFLRYKSGTVLLESINEKPRIILGTVKDKVNVV